MKTLAVKIRLNRMGAKKRPFYRIVVHDRAFRFWQSVEQESNGKGYARFHDSCGIHV